MNVTGTASYATEALFGPPSQRINLREFIENSKNLLRSSTYNSSFNPESDREIEKECTAADIRHTIEDALSNPFKHAHVVRTHENAIRSISNKSQPSKKRKHAEDAHPSSSGADKQPQVSQEAEPIAESLSAIKLACWPYPTEASHFVRPPKNSDYNVLRNAKNSRQTPASSTGQELQNTKAGGSNPASQSEATTESSQLSDSVHHHHDAIVSISVYTRLSWNTQLTRLSQHALLASQTLGDLYDVIPCPANEIPQEDRGDDGAVRGYLDADSSAVGDGNGEEASLLMHTHTHTHTHTHRGAVMCIEDVAYGDGQSEEDYSDKLLTHLAQLPSSSKDSQPQITKGAPMHNTTLSSLSLRINTPYWLLHQGSCEHFLIIDSIRLLHPSDPHPHPHPHPHPRSRPAQNPNPSPNTLLSQMDMYFEVEGEGEGRDKDREGPADSDVDVNVDYSPYPLTLYISPPILDLCMACSRVPATLAVSGDMRLGHSPFKICGPCWRCMGFPTDEEREGKRVVVARLVRHEHGW